MRDVNPPLAVWPSKPMQICLQLLPCCTSQHLEATPCS